jgi:hypothetical protein
MNILTGIVSAVKNAIGKGPQPKTEKEEEVVREVSFEMLPNGDERITFSDGTTRYVSFHSLNGPRSSFQPR